MVPAGFPQTPLAAPVPLLFPAIPTLSSLAQISSSLMSFVVPVRAESISTRGGEWEIQFFFRNFESKPISRMDIILDQVRRRITEASVYTKLEE
jgi:hypothetical protein